MVRNEKNQGTGLCTKISTVIRQLGWREAGFYFSAKLFSVLTNGHGRLVRYHLIAQPIPPAQSMGIRPSPKTSIGFIDKDDPLAPSLARPAAVIAKRFIDGNLCLAAETDGKLAGFMWLARRQYDEDEVRCCYRLLQPDRSVWDFDVYVTPRFRLGRTLARLWDFANSYLAAEGIRWSFSRISGFNTDSLRAHARLGGRKICSATFFCLGKAQLSIVTMKPFVHVSFSKTRRPTLLLAPPD